MFVPLGLMCVEAYGSYIYINVGLHTPTFRRNDLVKVMQ